MLIILIAYYNYHVFQLELYTDFIVSAAAVRRSILVDGAPKI